MISPSEWLRSQDPAYIIFRARNGQELVVKPPLTNDVQHLQEGLDRLNEVIEALEDYANVIQEEIDEQE